MRGVPLTPEQIEKAADVFARTGNLSEAARSIGVAESTLRGAFARERVARDRELHARALARGLRKGRQRLRQGLVLAEELLTSQTDGRAWAAVLNAASKATDSLRALDEHDDRRRQARLTRDKTRLEIEFLQKRIDGELPADRLEITDSRARRARIEELLARRRADPGGGTGAAPPAGSGGEGSGGGPGDPG